MNDVDEHEQFAWSLPERIAPDALAEELRRLYPVDAEHEDIFGCRGEGQ